MTERVQKAIDIFLDAINDGTLAKGNCVACAVGNLVAYGLGGKITRIKDDVGDVALGCDVDNVSWSIAFSTGLLDQNVHHCFFEDEKVLSNIAATDFSLEELMAIEFAFEINTEIRFRFYANYTPEQIRADQIKGLEAVVKVMLSFDSDKEVQDAEVYECFTSKAELIPLG
jgi:hypothetical protein